MSFAVIGHGDLQCKPGALSPLPSLHMGTTMVYQYKRSILGVQPLFCHSQYPTRRLYHHTRWMQEWIYRRDCSTQNCKQIEGKKDFHANTIVEYGSPYCSVCVVLCTYLSLAVQAHFLNGKVVAEVCVLDHIVVGKHLYV